MCRPCAQCRGRPPPLQKTGVNTSAHSGVGPRDSQYVRCINIVKNVHNIYHAASLQLTTNTLKGRACQRIRNLQATQFREHADVPNNKCTSTPKKQRLSFPLGVEAHRPVSRGVVHVSSALKNRYNMNCLCVNAERVRPPLTDMPLTPWGIIEK